MRRRYDLEEDVRAGYQWLMELGLNERAEVFAAEHPEVFARGAESVQTEATG